MSATENKDFLDRWAIEDIGALMEAMVQTELMDWMELMVSKVAMGLDHSSIRLEVILGLVLMDM
ncbi:MAG: Uncharacterised protein [Methanobacteriota archaeon]|nr:MAG: Uncharacterised protein [Euryarchaeota archaeon]